MSQMTETTETEGSLSDGRREPLRDDRGGDRGDPPRSDGRRLRRRGPRERGRPGDGRAVRHPRGGQLHGQGGARADLPGADRRALRAARPQPDGGQERSAAADRLHGDDRGRRRGQHRHLRPRPRPHDPGRDRPRVRPRATSSCPATCSRCGPKTAACWSGPATPRPASTSPASPAWRPAGVICEVMNDDGTMARVPDLVPYCERHGLKMITVADLIAYRRRTEKLVERVVATGLPTAFGDFTAIGYRSLVDDKHHVAMVKGEVDGAADVLVRVHSECLTGDVFHSLRCDCGEQLAAALAMIEREGRGVLLYLSQEGRGHRPAQQAARLQAPGGGRGHGRGEPEAGPAGRPARLRDRRPDPRRPRPDQHPHPHQQPEKDRRPGGLRALGQRAGADRRRPQRPQRGLPAGEAGQARPHRSTTRASPSTRR